jgi:hypothetical protein
MRDLFKVNGRKKAAVVALVYLGLEFVLIAARNDHWFTVFVLLTSPWSMAFSIFFSVAPSWLTADNMLATAFYWTTILLYMTLNPLLIYVVGGWIEQLTS